MKITTIGKRGVVFTFNDLSSEEYDSPTNIFVINGNKHIFICDTFLGPETMKGVQEYINENFSEKPIIVFNSHHHWDHHWGNCFYKEHIIIGNELTEQMINQNAKEMLTKNKKFHRGDITITPPNVLFQNKLSFLQDDVLFFFSPGHTADSSSCFDLQDKVLFAADNLEEPIPYLPGSKSDLLTYINTLYQYQKLEPEIIIPGHGTISDQQLLQKNIAYLETFPELAKIDLPEKLEKLFLITHMSNLNTTAEKFEEEAKTKEAKTYYRKLVAIAKKHQLLNDQKLEKIEEKIISL